MKDWTQRMADKLEMVSKRDAGLLLRGAKKHRYHLLPPITEQELESLERRYGIRLPGDYRLFIKELGNGGAGPGSGLQRFGWAPDWIVANESDDSDQLGEFSFMDGMWWHTRHADRVARPFPIRETVEVRRMPGGPYGEWDDWYAPYFHDGYIVLSIDGHVLGGDPVAILIVAGSSYGSVWVQDLAYNHGLYRFCDFASKQRQKPWPDDNTDYTFAEWYEYWLDECLQQLDRADVAP